MKFCWKRTQMACLPGCSEAGAEPRRLTTSRPREKSLRIVPRRLRKKNRGIEQMRRKITGEEFWRTGTVN